MNGRICLVESHRSILSYQEKRFHCVYKEVAFIVARERQVRGLRRLTMMAHIFEFQPRGQTSHVPNVLNPSPGFFDRLNRNPGAQVTTEEWIES